MKDNKHADLDLTGIWSSGGIWEHVDWQQDLSNWIQKRLYFSHLNSAKNDSDSILNSSSKNNNINPHL